MRKIFPTISKLQEQIHMYFICQDMKDSFGWEKSFPQVQESAVEKFYKFKIASALAFTM